MSDSIQSYKNGSWFPAKVVPMQANFKQGPAGWLTSRQHQWLMSKPAVQSRNCSTYAENLR